MPKPRFCWRALTIVAVTTFFGASAHGQPPPPAGGAPDGAQELTRGPIHEAFGQPTTFDPQAGPISPKQPPEPVEELPPEQKPEGDNVAWIPGYWHWDDEGKDFLWVSGLWRTVPAGRSWVPGYWTQVDEGYQWVSGFWGAAQADEVEYLPPPPESLESGPSVEATVDGQIWVPGCWMWRESRYVWRPGFWSAGNPDWLWVPAHYSWTPSGYLFHDGFWDYPLFRRGLLFAPVSFVDVRPGFVYRPTVVINIQVLVVNLFVRPRYHHYFFGDYYANSYAQAGIYPWFAFHNSRYGYDPLFAHTNFMYSRRDVQWASQIREAFVYRREHEAARPPRTFRAYGEWARRRQADDGQAIALARPINAVAQDREAMVRLERVSERQTEVIKKQVTQIRQFRDQRVRIERQAAEDIKADPGAKVDPKSKTRPGRKTPARVKLPERPKLGPVVGAKGPETGGPPAEGPRAPAIDPKSPPVPTPKGRPKTLPDPEDNFRRDPATGRPLPKEKGSDPTRPPVKDKDDRPIGKDRPKLDPPDRPKLPPIKDRPKLDPPDRPKVPPMKDRPKLDPPDRPKLPPIKDRPKLDPPDRPDPPAKKDRPKLDPPDRPKLPPVKDRPKLDPPDRPKGPPAKGPPPKKDKDKDG
jgi:hypothetical protein